METVVGKQEPNDIRVFKPLVTFRFPFPITAPAPHHQMAELKVKRPL